MDGRTGAQSLLQQCDATFEIIDQLLAAQDPNLEFEIRDSSIEICEIKFFSDAGIINTKALPSWTTFSNLARRAYCEAEGFTSVTTFYG